VLARQNNLFSIACICLSLLSAGVLCLGLRVFIGYQGYALEHADWLGSAYRLFTQSGAINSINAKARLLQLCLLVLWCGYGGVTLWAFMRHTYVGLRSCLCLLLLCAVVLIAGFYAFAVWMSTNILLLNLSLLVGLLLWAWVGCANRGNMQPPGYRYRVLKPWVAVAFILVLMQAILSCVIVVTYNSACQFWPYCSGGLHAPASGSAKVFGSTMLLFLARDFSYHFAFIVCFCYLLTLAAFLIFMHTFAPLRRLGIFLLICASAQFYLGMHAAGTLGWFAAVVWQQASIFTALIVLVCLMQRVFSKNVLRRLDAGYR
jgi:hypothetical protein